MTWLPGTVRRFVGKVAAPAVTDDINDGFEISDIWVDETANKAYICLDNAVGSADWNQIDVAAGVGSGSLTTIEENSVQVGGADIVTLDFLGADFDLDEDVDTHIKIIINAAIARLASPTFSGTVSVPSTNLTIGSTTFSETQLGDLTDGGDTTLHDHDGIAENTAARHTAGTDTTLGTMTADIDMDGSYQVVGLQAPAAAGEALRQTVNVTEADLETLTDGSDSDGLHAHAVNDAKNTNVPIATDVIWDAAGDLVYGTGADTASRLAAGATTEILVGGGAAAPVWTTVTGTGAPVKATSPTLVTPLLGTPTSGNLSSCSDYPLASLTGAPTLISIEGLTIAAGVLIYGTAADTTAALAAGATTEILVGGGAAAPVWTTAQGTGAPVRATSPTLVTPNIGAATLGGTLTVGEYGVQLDPALSGDNTYSGITTSGLIGYASPDLGDLVYLDDTVDRWEKTDANAVGTAGNVQLGLVVSPDGSGSDGDACVILLFGYMKETDFNFTAQGNALYVSETAGLITDTAPTTASAMVRVVGYAGADADTVFFNPSKSWVEIAA